MKKAILCFLALAMVFSLVTVAYADDSHLYSVLDSGKLRVAVIPDNPGWSVMTAEGDWVGYDVEIAKLLAETLGVEVEFVPTEGGNRVTMVQTDKCDVVIACLTATLERAKSVAFSLPYAAGGLIPLCRADNMIESWENLADKKISLARGSTGDVFATEAFPDAEITRFDAIADAFVALKTKKVDVLLEEDAAVYLLAQDDAEVAPMNVDIKNGAYISFASAQEDSIWLNYLNTFIQANMYNGKFNELYANAFGHDLPKLTY